jgi:inositol transport system ATP-binding protein
MRELLQVKGLSKSFGGINALDDVRLTLRAGEVHALMGENGAGKSTFMKLLIGLYHPDSGKILLEGNDVKQHKTLQKQGISMIHQEMLVVPELTVAQNLFLGREKEVLGKGSLWLNDQLLVRKAGELLQRMGLDIAPDRKIKHLSVAEMQMVEIAKAVSNDAKVIIMDEPTSAISDKEVSVLFKIISDLKQKGVGIIYISHKMDEIFEIADTITVLRDGKYIGTHPASELTRDTLIAMMVGREIRDMFPEMNSEKGVEALEVRELNSAGKFSGINFKVHSGEILGIAGLMGAGRTEIARAIFGLDKFGSGEVYVKGSKVVINSPQGAIGHGIGYVSEDRKGLGFIPDLSVKHNITLGSIKVHAKSFFINSDSESVTTDRMVSDLRIKSSGSDQKVANLSGGNQQKVVIGKVLLSNPDIVILDEPTRGIDVGAKFEIYKLIKQLTDRGIAIVLISSELPEILGMSDRILVLSKGKQTALLTKQEATQETIMNYAVQ